MMRLGSLCTGYGGLDMAVMDVLDAAPVWHAQYDPDDRHQYAARILAHHWPDVPNLGDITAVDWGSVEPVDILTAGFPCQPVSNAGKRKGVDDERWLWPDVEAAIRGVRPRLVLLENVSAIANRGGTAFSGRWPPSGSMRSGLVYERPTSVPRTVEPGGSASPGASMTTSGCGPGDLSNPKNRTRLEPPPALLPTPRASANENRQTKRTPSQETGTHGKNLAAEVCELLPTPRASDTGTPGRRASEGFQPPLSEVVLLLLPTPTAQPHSRNSTARRAAPKDSTNTQGSTLLDVFWTGDPTDPPSSGGST